MPTSLSLPWLHLNVPASHSHQPPAPPAVCQAGSMILPAEWQGRGRRNQEGLNDSGPKGLYAGYDKPTLIIVFL